MSIRELRVAGYRSIRAHAQVDPIRLELVEGATRIARVNEFGMSEEE